MGWKRFIQILLLTFIWAGIAFPVSAFAQAIGSVDRVIEKANRQPPGQAKVLANAGDALVQNELLETLAASTMHVLFVDGTDLTLESDSQVVLDTYVYDPSTNSAKAVYSFATGTMRYVSGQIGQGATINTPIATIGIRGTAFTCSLTPGSSGVELSCEVTEGSIEVRPKGEGRPTVAAAGQVIVLTSANANPTLIGNADPGLGRRNNAPPVQSPSLPTYPENRDLSPI